MLEKIKITVPKNTYDILVKDCQNFGFTKKDDSLNKNLFLNTLIINYYEKFSSNEEEFKDKLLKAINQNVHNNQNELLEEILSIFQKNDTLHSDNKSETINLKPTKLSEKTILFIENNLIQNNSISSFYRNLFTSYAHIPQNFRERIIFKETYECILESIEKDRTVYLYLLNGDVIKDASIYKIESSIDELFNYVLICINNSMHTIRLSKIKYITISNSKREIPEKSMLTFERQIKYGVQYPFYTPDDEIVIVKMTDKGKELFKKIYLYRPIPDKIEENYYYFNCSHNQVSHYFKRFGKDGIIIYPRQLAESMKKYYFMAGIKYDKALK